MPGVGGALEKAQATVSWRHHTHVRSKILRGKREMRGWYLDREYVPNTKERTKCENQNDIEGLEGALRSVNQKGDEGWEVAWERNPWFRDWLCLQHLRLYTFRKWFVVVRTADGIHQLLVLKVLCKVVTCAGRRARIMVFVK